MIPRRLDDYTIPRILDDCCRNRKAGSVTQAHLGNVFGMCESSYHGRPVSAVICSLHAWRACPLQSPRRAYKPHPPALPALGC